MSPLPLPFHVAVRGAVRLQYFRWSDDTVTVGLYRRPSTAMLGEAYVHLSPADEMRTTLLCQVLPADTAQLLAALLGHGTNTGGLLIVTDDHGQSLVPVALGLPLLEPGCGANDA
ncbi:hypothetical protein [Deinococcus ruber]|nr:hypothetical protein [Deinococcus ruber]